MQHAGASQIIDLCSGGSGPWILLQEQLEEAGLPARVILTDKYPNQNTIEKWNNDSRQDITYLSEPVDAMQVPQHLKGMRTLFEGFHHFTPEQARAILKNASDDNSAIGIFEASLKPPFGLILLILAPLTTFLAYFFVTPFIKPRIFSRFLWTYIIPLVPLATCWDGIISMLRVYSVEELKELTATLQSGDYVWEAGQALTGTPIFMFTYLLGYPLYCDASPIKKT